MSESNMNFFGRKKFIYQRRQPRPTGRGSDQLKTNTPILTSEFISNRLVWLLMSLQVTSSLMSESNMVFQITAILTISAFYTRLVPLAT